ncbi:NAD(P)/FAD-dependent oxidoreductase [uncultured Robinsoniella sp.]|uniref:NAD(P)/FAD-dependent oxidoreductase n=1 Tax=uncultured Robinsoniella sp. TaxID=904190 RepID=UPI00374F925A
MKKVFVIGAGASGLLAAIAAARNGAAVTILEGMEKPGKKLLTTGNGKCNITNTDMSDPNVYRSGNPEFTRQVLEQFSVSDTLAFFEDLGLLLKDRGGYIYPYVEQASAVLDLLLMEVKRLSIKLKCMEKVKRLYRSKETWQIETSGWTYTADAVILTAGSKAAPVTGSDGSGYELAEMAGHSIVPALPALVPLKVTGDWFKSLAGVRSHSRLALYVDQDLILTETGELQWTDYGISGIVVFQLSRYAVRALAENKNVTVSVDLMPDFDTAELINLLHKRCMQYPNRTIEESLTGLLNKKMITVMLKKAKMKHTKSSGAVTVDEIKSLTCCIKNSIVKISGSRDFTQAQICSGGVSVNEVDNASLESRIAPGLFLAGEILDIDGACGGYNLQWAWSSGYTAGLHSTCTCINKTIK